MTKITALLIAILMGGGFLLEATSLTSKKTGRAFPWNDGPPTAHSRLDFQ